jgi:hypothetical protein
MRRYKKKVVCKIIEEAVKNRVIILYIFNGVLYSIGDG